MSQRTPLVVSCTALVVAVFGATPLGHTGGERLAAAVPFAKSAGYATLAGNSAKLNGRKSTLAGAPGSIPVVGSNGKLPAALGTVGPRGPQGPTGPKGRQGATGSKGDAGSPGVSGLEIVRSTVSVAGKSFNGANASCPAGKLATGGGAEWSSAIPTSLALVGSSPVVDASGTPTGWVTIGANANLSPDRLTVFAICARVAP